MTQFTPGFMVDIQVLSGLVCTSYGAKQSPADFAPTSQVKRLSKNRGGPLASQPLLLTPSLQDQKGGASNGGFHKWRYPHSWMVYSGKSPSKMDDLGVPPFMESSYLRT